MKVGDAINDILKKFKRGEIILEQAHDCICIIIDESVSDALSKKAYDKLVKIHMKYHNANCGPFNRTLENLIKQKAVKTCATKHVIPPKHECSGILPNFI